MSRYIEIYESLKKDIINGIYPVGEKIPSKRQTAENYNSSLITVEHAYDLLINESYIEPVEKKGYFVIYDEMNSYDGKREKETYASIENATEKPVPFETYPLSFSTYSKTVRKVLSENPGLTLEKSPNAGMEKLRLAISGYLGRSRHIIADSSQIIIGSGAEYLYRLIVSALGRDINYAIESPSYEQITKMYKAENVDVRLLPLVKDGIDSNALWNTDAEVLHITPYRSFPSRVTATASKKREYLRWSHEKDSYIIEDDCESEFSPSRKAEETLFAIESNSNVIYVNTFSMTISPSLRMGYMVIPQKLQRLFTDTIGFYSCPVPVLEQLVVAKLIESGEFERHLNRIRRMLRTK